MLRSIDPANNGVKRPRTELTMLDFRAGFASAPRAVAHRNGLSLIVAIFSLIHPFPHHTIHHQPPNLPINQSQHKPTTTSSSQSKSDITIHSPHLPKHYLLPTTPTLLWNPPLNIPTPYSPPTRHNHPLFHSTTYPHLYLLHKQHIYLPDSPYNKYST